MATVCSRCGSAEAVPGRCVTCYSPEGETAKRVDIGGDDEEQLLWQNLSVSRVAVGLGIALGLEYSLLQFLRVVLRGVAERWIEDGFSTSLLALTLALALQVTSLLFAGAIIGAGHRRGWLLGAVVGFLNGIALILWEWNPGVEYSEFLQWTRPPIHALVGAFGGMIGSGYWQPIPLLGLRTVEKQKIPMVSWNFLAGPVYLGHVFAGIFVVVMGVVWSHAIFDYLVVHLRNSAPMSTHYHGQLVIWEISALATVLGAGIAGSNTYNGLKHGMCVAVGATGIVLGIQLSTPNPNFDAILLNLGGIIFFSLFGGWFGSMLFPPLTAAPKRRHSFRD